MDGSDAVLPIMIGGVYGGLPGATQTVPRSELYAAVHVMEATGEAPVWLLSECKYFTDKARGLTARSSGCDNHDLWERYWSAHSLKAGDVRVTKVKAHGNLEDLREGHVSFEDYAGNAYADRFAVEGAEKVQLPFAITGAVQAMDAMGWQVRERIVAMICASPTKAAHDKDAVLAKKAKEARKQQQQEDEEEAKRLAEFLAASEPAAPPARPASPTPAPLRLGGLRSTPLHASHSLCQHRSFTWCWTCGKFATTRGRELFKPCKGGANAAGAEVIRRVKAGKTPHSKLDWPD